MSINAIGLVRGIEDMAASEEISEDALLMVKDVDTGKMFVVKSLSTEYHHDADGTQTVWINAEEM